MNSYRCYPWDDHNGKCKQSSILESFAKVARIDTDTKLPTPIYIDIDHDDEDVYVEKEAPVHQKQDISDFFMSAYFFDQMKNRTTLKHTWHNL